MNPYIVILLAVFAVLAALYGARLYFRHIEIGRAHV